MKVKGLFPIVLGLVCSMVWAADAPAPVDTAPPSQATTTQAPQKDVVPEVELDLSSNIVIGSELDNFCFVSGFPPIGTKFVQLRRLKVGKGTYGGVKEILPKLAARAKADGADAIVNYSGHQRFGFWPWKLVRPVVQGTGIKLLDTPQPNCEALGGATLKTILDTDTPPPPKK